MKQYDSNTMYGTNVHSAKVESCTPQLVAGNEHFELFTEGDLLFEAMLTAISNAKELVWLETYIFAADEVGHRFAEVLIARAVAGVEIRLLVDALGSFWIFPDRLERSLRDAGVKVRRYHRWSWREPLRYNRRDHRKLLVVDRQQAFLGGFNINRQSSALACGKSRWRDTHVSMTGGMAKKAAELFDAFWYGKPKWSPEPGAGIQSELLANSSRACRQRLRCIYSEILNHSSQYLYVTTPYFVPDRRMQKGLIAAAQRGVDVRLLVPRKSDVRLVQWAARAAYTNLLINGVRIFEYLPRMLHAKTVVVDDNYATIGTANMDYRSFFLNYELNLFSGSRDLCFQLFNQFNTDLKESEEIIFENWKQRHWSAHFLEWIGWIARRWL